MEYKENLELARKLNIGSWILSVIVIAVVFGMRSFKIETDYDLSVLPAFHSTVNALAGIVLLVAIYYIKKGNVKAHRNAILLAMFLSLIFLLSYVAYHLTQEEVKYCGEGAIRYVYFFLLITHILAAAVIFPFVLFTFVRGFTFQVEKHRKMAKWVFPIWLFVCFSGPITYLMLKPCY